MNIYRWLFVLVLALSVGCDPGLPGGGFNPDGMAAPLTQEEFNQLPPEQQHEVANKLMGVLYRGVSAEDYFDLDAGLAELQPRSSTFLEDTRASLSSETDRDVIAAIDREIDGIDPETGIPDEANAKYTFDTDNNLERSLRPTQLPLARIREYPISRELFVQWMAYFLSNTIMFSPAVEMESVDYEDVQILYRFLVRNISENRSVREIVRAHLPSRQRWRVSRSAENHALEAYELYLGLFETEEDSRRGGIACRDHSLTTGDDFNRYNIVISDFPNTVPQLVLADEDVSGSGFYITTCSDLYDLVSSHPLLMPRVIEVILNYMMAGRSPGEQLAMGQAIAASNPQTFEDIFTAIIFSREFLLNTERPKSFEENFLPLLENLNWHPQLAGNNSIDENIFEYMASGAINGNIGNDAMYMGNMGWNVMSLKIGRLPDVPLDALSFSNYHRAIREVLFIQAQRFGGSSFGGTVDGLFYDADGELRPFIEGLSTDDFIDYLFLNVLKRKADNDETSGIITIFQSNGHMTTLPDGSEVIRTNRYNDVAAITLDYISRLPEFYYFRAIN